MLAPRASALSRVLPAALLVMGGCHLLYPFGVREPTTDGPHADGSTGDATVEAGPTDAPPRDGPPASDLLHGDLLSGPDAGGSSIHQWGKTAGGSTYTDWGHDVVVTASGSVCVTGQFYDSIDLGGLTLASKGASDIFLACYDAGGKHIWSKAFGSSGLDAGRALATAGNRLCLAGQLGAATSFGGGSVGGFGGADAAVACFDLSGNHIWSTAWGDSEADQAFGIAVDGAGTTTVTGGFLGGITFNKQTKNSKGQADIFLVQLNSSGKHIWSTTYGDSQNDYGRAVATTSAGVVLVGDFRGTINIGGGSYTSAGSTDVFVATYNSSGTNTGATIIKGSGNDVARDVAVGGGGMTYLCGSFTGEITIGGKKHTSAGITDVFVAALTSTGTASWSHTLGASGSDGGYGVALSSTGVHVTGFSNGTVTSGSLSYTSKGQDDALVVSYGLSGGLKSLHGLGGSGMDRGQGIAASSAGVVYITGTYSSTVDFGGGPVTSKGAGDIFLVALKP